MKDNSYTSKKIPLLNLLKWGISKHFSNSSYNSHKRLPIITQEKLPQEKSFLWLGHATLWININDTKIIIDPVLGNIPFYKRHTKLPIDKAKLMADIVLITHAHYDHFDMPSIKFLIEQNPNITIIAPAGFKRYLKKYSNLIELNWWKNTHIKDVNITFVPSLHWSNRIGIDKNKALWGGYIVEFKDYALYHAGDSGYGEHFIKIGQQFVINDAFLPIGAYKPEYIMSQNHMNPQEAMKACEDLKANRFIPIHYGTFKLSDEAMHEPLEWIEMLLIKSGYPFETRIANIGEVIFI